MNNYNFPVELTPVKTQPYNKIIPGKQAVVRTDTQETLGIVSGKYGLIKHEIVVDSFREALQVNYKEEIKLTNNGAYMFAVYTLSQSVIEVVKSDLVNLQFVVKNSYNGSNSLQIILGAFRLVCSNGMILGKEVFQFRQTHIGSNIIKQEELQNNIKLLSEQFQNALPTMQKMAKVQPSGDKPLFEAPKPYLPKYLMENAKQSYFEKSDLSVWGYYNSLTAAITHGMKKENPAAKIELGKNAWELALAQM